MTVHTCTPKRLPEASIDGALIKAVEINLRNYSPVTRFKRLLPTHYLDRASLSILVERKWKTNGVRLTVGFLDNPEPVLRRRILAHMNAWGTSANVAFTETSGEAQVRIARGGGEDGGYWSYLGTDVLLIDADKPTMNLEGFTMNTPESEFIRVVRHETGHTLGFPHEHMRRELVEKIDREKAIAYYMATQGWSREEVIAQVLTPIEDGSLLGTPRADSNSIMCYQIPGALTRDHHPIPGGADIDTLDYDFAATCYPHAPAAAAMEALHALTAARDTGGGVADFSQAQAETCVIDGVLRVPAEEPSLTDTVADAFDDADKVRVLLSCVQDVIHDLGIFVSLASGSDAEMTELGKESYLSLAAWVRDQVLANGKYL